jgi:hypothetical protein
MTTLLWEDGAQGEIGYLYYSLDPDGNGLILTVDARCVNAKCDANFMARVFDALASVIKSGTKFAGAVTAVAVDIHGAFGTKTNGVLWVRWQDAVDFAQGRMTFQELTQRAFIYHIEQAE